jgi:excinuclease ABC subunit B
VHPARTQVDDLLAQIRATVQRGFRVLVTTLTKRMAEELTTYYSELGVRVRYLHSEIDAIERTLDPARPAHGGVRRADRDQPPARGAGPAEVALVAILDADKEGFLRNATSLIQTCGRAARNVEGRVILYADRETDSMRAALSEMQRRREKQSAYNAEHGIVPRTIIKAVRDGIESLYEMDYVELAPAPEPGGGKSKGARAEDQAWSWAPERLRGEIVKLREDMLHASGEMRFEDAARLRDRLRELEQLELGR